MHFGVGLGATELGMNLSRAQLSKEKEGDEPDALDTNTAQDTTPQAPPSLTFGPGFPVLPLGPLSPRGPLKRHKR